jgi:hypothetical protein
MLDLPTKNKVISHTYVSLPEGTLKAIYFSQPS